MFLFIPLPSAYFHFELLVFILSLSSSNRIKRATAKYSKHSLTRPSKYTSRWYGEGDNVRQKAALLLITETNSSNRFRNYTVFCVSLQFWGTHLLTLGSDTQWAQWKCGWDFHSAFISSSNEHDIFVPVTQNKCQLLTQFAVRALTMGINLLTLFVKTGRAMSNVKFMVRFETVHNCDGAICVCVCAGSEVEFLMRHWRQSHKTCLNFFKIATFRVEKDLQFVHRWFWVCCYCCSRDLSVERAMPCHFIMWIQQQENYLMRQIRSSLSRRLMLSWQFYSIEWYEASNFQLRESIQCHEDTGSWSVLGFVEIITNHECICVWKQRRQ